ncbi:L,D-transpeptidase [Luteolibacter pohnpeiensis]|uniref:L,D-transpeptidase n=1 Tax=Luteolibacter pohnpeiensis TaxID=454153 RepID=A0A934VVH8_9BACT|nr:L,D-transpeptidase [Luteolibacter pohnpeiensis]MBK1881813.1 L,D-transpeptidase [Luteolibacter pohnpeiensis]
MIATKRLLSLSLAAATALLLVNCSPSLPPDGKPVTDANGKPVNPYPEGTYDHFRAEPNYRKTYDVYKNEELLTKTDESNSSIVINLSNQRAQLMNGDKVAMDYPICSGTEERPTPPGDYKILEKIVDKHSNTYGKIVDAEGEVVNSNADVNKDPIPEGGKFIGAPMAYWMRLTWDGVGHHVGPVRRYPASHACVRGPKGTMPIVYSKVKVGTSVRVQ